MASIGKPLKYKPEEMESKINEYFNYCSGIDPDTNRFKYFEPITVSGLCEYLDIDRKQLDNYRKKEAYNDSIERAYRKIVAFAESQLYRTTGQTKGIEFSLKYNWGWNDNQIIEVKQQQPDFSGLTTEEIKSILTARAAAQLAAAPEDQTEDLEDLE